MKYSLTVALAAFVMSAGCTNSGFTSASSTGSRLENDGSQFTPSLIPPTAGDGSANAPAGPAQRPTLLAGFKVRPPFRVAGVDYAVGIPAGKVLKNPSTIAMAGVTVNATQRMIYVTGNNVTFDGYDFSLNGGWGIDTTAANTRIFNSNFLIGANNIMPVVAQIGSSNLYVGYCVLDAAGKDVGSGTIIRTRGQGFVVEYNWFKNAGGDMIQQVDHGSSVVIRYNLMEQGGLSPGAHGDYTQLAGGPFTLSMVGNTTFQSGGTTQGLMTEYVSSGEISKNVSVGSVSYVTSVDISSISTTVTVSDNYFANPAFGFIYPNAGPGDGSAKTIFKNNVNMVNGSVIQD